MTNDSELSDENLLTAVTDFTVSSHHVQHVVRLQVQQFLTDYDNVSLFGCTSCSIVVFLTRREFLQCRY